MTDRLIAYLLDGLSHDERVEVEAHLLVDRQWRDELARLARCLADTGDPLRCKDEPPGDLVGKTCKLVEESGDCLTPVRVGAAVVGAANAPMMSPMKVCPGARRRWSFGDALVAAGVMIVIASFVAPTMTGARDDARRLACQDNLRWLGTQLFDYQQRHAHRLPGQRRTQNAGFFSTQLANDGGVSRNELARRLVCPDSTMADEIRRGALVLVIPTPRQWDAADGSERRRLAHSMGGSYAYALGYIDAEGKYHPVEFTGSAKSLLLADAPKVLATGVRITNHGGQGQNVLDQSMAVRFRSKCVLVSGKDHIFLNAEGKHAAGCDADDIVLGRSEYDPLGRIVPVKDEP